MTHSTSTNALRSMLRSVSARLDATAILEGGATGLLPAAMLALLGWREGWSLIPVAIAGLVLAILFAVVRLLMSRRERRRAGGVAALIERRAGGIHNVLVTAAEVDESPRALPAHISARLNREASAISARLKPSALFPFAKQIAGLGAAAALWILVLALAATNVAFPPTLMATGDTAPSLRDVMVTITPPEYSGLQPRTVQNPDAIEALAGSVLEIEVDASAATVILETVASEMPLVERNRSFSGEIRADVDGFISLEPRDAAGERGSRTLIGLTVLPDNAPRARVIAPGRDLFLEEAPPALEIAIEADDDIGLASLSLRYTRVSGSGEQFSFAEGDIPIQVTRTDARMWRGSARWNLAALGLTPGDMLVYRAITSDHRPGAPRIESDTYIVEVLGPGALAAGGFSIDDEYDRYALSQAMVIMKTERLLARRDSMSAEDFAEGAQDIAIEQRRVRAEFIFMMGGDLGDEIELDATGMGDLDEHSHAAMDDEAISGRLAHEGRLDLIRAIRSMSRASATLTEVDVPDALQQERDALQFLQRAFSRTRYILRTLTERERLDLGRRLTGALTAASRLRQPEVLFDQDTVTVQLRQQLAAIASLASSRGEAAERASRANILATEILRLDPASETMRDASRNLTLAAEALASSRPDDALVRLDSAATLVATVLRSSLLSSSGAVRSGANSRLEGALADELRRGSVPRR